MKKFYIMVSLIPILCINLVNATTIIIQCQGTTVPTDIFVPSAANAICGDTIKWIWVSGVHTTSSTSIPGGASRGSDHTA